MNAPEPTILCPKCQSEIKLTETIAEPMVRATRARLEAEFAQERARLREETQRRANEEFGLRVVDLEQQLQASKQRLGQAQQAELAARRLRAEYEDKLKTV